MEHYKATEQDIQFLNKYWKKVYNDFNENYFFLSLSIILVV